MPRAYVGRKTPSLQDEIDALHQIRKKAREPSSVKRSDLAKLSFRHVPPFVARKIHQTTYGSYPCNRTFREYNAGFAQVGLNTIPQLIKSNPKRNLRLLDAVAGEGKCRKGLMEYLAEHRDKDVQYHAVDLRERQLAEGDRFSRKVRALDLVAERLPNNFFDIIVMGVGLPYVVDKIKVIENLVNSLRVGGVLQISSVIHTTGRIYVNGRMLTSQEADRKLLQSVLERPWLEVKITSQGALQIKKKAKHKTEFGLRFLRAGKANSGEALALREELKMGYPPNASSFLYSFYSQPKKRATVEGTDADYLSPKKVRIIASTNIPKRNN